MTVLQMISQQQTLLTPSTQNGQPLLNPWEERPAIWSWQWNMNRVASIEDACETLLAYGYRDVYAKALDGQYWMGMFDSSPLAPRNAGHAAVISDAFDHNGVNLHWWTVPRGVNLTLELQQLGSLLEMHPHSLILDIEPYDEFWTGILDDVHRYVEFLHHYETPVALAPDARYPHWQNLHGDVWAQAAQAIMPQLYWPSFEQPWSIATERMYAGLGTGLPIYPIIQADSKSWEIEDAMKNFRERGSTSFSIWVWHILPWDHASLALAAFNGYPH